MAAVIYPLNAGPQDGAVTAANAGSGGSNPTTNGGTAKYGTASGWTGFVAIFTNAAGASTVCQLRFVTGNNAGNSLTMAEVVTFISPATTPIENEIFYIGRGVANVAAYYLKHTTANELAIYDAAQLNKVVLITGVTPNTAYRIEKRFVIGTSTTGQYTINVYPGVGTTPINGSPVTSSSYNLGTVALIGADVGRAGGTNNVHTAGIAYLGFNAGSTTEIGPPAAVGAATANAGVDQDKTSGDILTLAGVVTNATSTVWTCLEYPAGAASPSISNATAMNASLPVVAGRYVMDLAATNSGGTVHDTMTAWVVGAVGEDVKVYSSTGAFSNAGGLANKVLAVNDASDSTGEQTPDSPTGQTETVTWCPIGLGPMQFVIRTVLVGAGITLSVTFFKIDGTTPIYGPVSWTTPASATDQVIDIDSPGLALVPLATDRRALVTVITASA